MADEKWKHWHRADLIEEIKQLTAALDVYRRQLVEAKADGRTPDDPNLLADLTDLDPCWYDHHGYCQAHGWFATEPICPHARAKSVLKQNGASDANPS